MRQSETVEEDLPLTEAAERFKLNPPWPLIEYNWGQIQRFHNIISFSALDRWDTTHFLSFATLTTARLADLIVKINNRFWNLYKCADSCIRRVKALKCKPF